MGNDDEVGNEFLSIKEFAILLNVHSNTIRRAVKSGRINAFKVGYGKKAIYRIARAEINRIAIFDLEEMIERIIEKRTNNHAKI